MALTTYAELLTAVASYDEISQTVEASNLPDLVKTAEQRIYFGHGRPGMDNYSAPLRCRALEKTIVVPVSSGEDGGTSAGTADAQTVTLAATPTLTPGLTITFTAGFTNTTAMTLNVNATGVYDVRVGRNRNALVAGDILAGSIVTVYFDGSYYVLMPSDGAFPLPSNWLGAVSVYMQDRKNPLTAMPGSGINQFMEGASAGTPMYYAVEGDCIRVDPKPAGTKYLSITYYKRPADLSVALNDVFLEAPSIYLFATLVELAVFLPAEERIPMFLSRFTGAISSYMQSDKASKFGYGPMRVRLGIAP